MNKQITEWQGKFGNDFVERTNKNDENPNIEFKKTYGIYREELNKEFIGLLNKDIKILEVGAGTGKQLEILKKMGFKNLYGIEINKDAIRRSRTKEDIYIIPGDACNIPFQDGFFDLVFTSMVLIHIAPVNISETLKEIYKCSKKYIWGYEYYDKEYIPRIYRGKQGLLWKANFAKMYLDLFPDLKLIKKKKLKYLQIPDYWEKEDYQDEMFLLKKS